MDLIIGQIFSPSKADQLAALDLLDPKRFPIADEYIPGLVKALKFILKRPEIRSVNKTLMIIEYLLRTQPSFSPFTVLLPDLIHLLKFEKYQVHQYLIRFLPELQEKSKDLSFFPKVMIDSGIVRKSEELKLATLRLGIDLCEIGIDLTEIKDFLNTLADDLSPLVQDSAYKLLKKIETLGSKPEKVQFKRENLEFTCIPATYLEKLSKSPSWREKLAILESIKEIFQSLDDFSAFSAHFSNFLSIITEHLLDQNSKIVNVCIEIIQIFLSSSLSSNPSLLSVLTPCLLKFSDTKISIRQAIHKLFRNFSKFHLKGVVLELEKGLSHANWHVREESVMVLIVLMLNYPHDYFYLTLAEKLAMLLDDPRTKIRLVSTEAIGVLGNIYGEGKVIDCLIELVDSNALNCLKEYFSNKNLPQVTEDYILLSKEIPSEVRMISSPYLLTMPQNCGSTSMSLQPKSETPTTAETFTERNIRGSIFTKTSSSVIYKSSSLLTIPKKSESSDFNPTYIPYDELEKLQHPAESLQKSTLRNENWLDHFETINTLRKLTKHHPEVFISKVTLHSIIINLVKWADSLRSGLSKNALICLKEMCEGLGKVLDGEISDVAKVFLKKTLDTNSFLAETAGEGLIAMCSYLNEQKILSQLLLLVEGFKNSLIKAKVLACFIRIIDRVKSALVKMNDFGKLMQFVNECLNDANPEVRNCAKETYALLIEIIPNEQSLGMAESNSMGFSIFKKVRNSIKKKPKPHSVSNAFIKQDLHVTLPSLSRVKSKKLIQKSARDLILLATSSEAEDLKKLSKLEQSINSPDWKERYDSITLLLDLFKNSFESFKSINKQDSLFLIIEKGLKDPNMKVLIHSLTYLSKIISTIKSEICQYLKLLMEHIVISMGCSNTSIRDAAFDVSKLLGHFCSSDELLPLIVPEIGKTSPKGKALVLNLVAGFIPAVKNKGYLEGEILNMAYKYVDDSRVDIRNEAGRIVVMLYKSLGNVVLESVPTKKLKRVINVISNKID